MAFNNEMLNALKKLATASDVNFRHAAMLIKDGIMYACGYNQYVTRGTIHAELSVFLKYPKRYGTGYDIIVVRINKQLQLRNSRPCADCINKMQKIGIRRVYYSNDKGEIVSEIVQFMEKTHISSAARIWN